jgi:hypothetical protein
LDFYQGFLINVNKNENFLDLFRKTDRKETNPIPLERNPRSRYGTTGNLRSEKNPRLLTASCQESKTFVKNYFCEFHIWTLELLFTCKATETEGYRTELDRCPAQLTKLEEKDGGGMIFHWDALTDIINFNPLFFISGLDL